MVEASISQLARFFAAILEDPRVTTTHISLYMALLYEWTLNHCANPVPIDRDTIMIRAKISGMATYFKCIHNLHEYGIIRYVAARHRYMQSVIYICNI
jgi:hypothetical protein